MARHATISPSTPRAAQKQATRATLIAAAMRVYELNGIAAARTADVAAAAGVSHGTVFVHFPTREALFAAAIEEFGTALARRVHELATTGAGVREVLSAHLQGIAEHEGFYSRLAIEAPLLPMQARRGLLSAQSAISFHLSQAAERDTAAGLIKPMPIHLLFNTWIGLVHYYLANRDMFAPDGSVIERYGVELTDHFMSLIASCPDQREEAS
jgi:AcrR family transcriptional regulator